MKAMIKVLAGCASIAAFAIAAPAAAQYYPGSPYPGYGMPYQGYGTQGYGTPYQGYGYGGGSQVAIAQCTSAVQARLNGGYGYGSPYGGAYRNAGGRVLGVSRIEPRAGGGMTIHGVASSGRANVYGYGYNQQSPDLTWRCRTDFRGMVMDVNVRPARTAYGSNDGYAPNGYTPNGNGYDNDYSQYGYQRY